jgi:hypothetical protein
MDNIPDVEDITDEPTAAVAVAAPVAAAAPSKKSVKTAKRAAEAVKPAEANVISVGFRAGAKLAPPSHHCILIGSNAGRNIVNGVGVVIISDTYLGHETMQSSCIIELLDIPDWRVDTMITIFKQAFANLDKFEGPIKKSVLEKVSEYLTWQIEALTLRLTGLVAAGQTDADASYVCETNRLKFK